MCAAQTPDGLRKCPKFKFRYTGSGTYSWHYNSGPGPGGEAPTDQLAAADFTWDVRYDPLIVFDKGSVQLFANAPNGVSGTWSFTESSSLDSCAGAGTLVPFDNPEIRGEARRGLHLNLGAGAPKTLDPHGTQGGCHISDFWQEWLYGMSQLGRADQVEALGSLVDLTPKQLSHKRTVIETSSATPRAPSLSPPSDCSFGLGGADCEQAFAWSGEVTVVRKR